MYKKNEQSIQRTAAWHEHYIALEIATIARSSEERAARTISE